MQNYDPHAIEAKWQARWASDAKFATNQTHGKPRRYFLVMFPYPSGPLHCGHWFMYTPPDAKARYLRMKGFDVLFPIGFDAFGLPAENAAIKRNIHPRRWTYSNITEMRNSFQVMGSSYDFSREILTCDPEYYKWTQWLFLEMYKNNLAYRAFAPVDWCPSCNTSLAREQVITEERVCERCRTPVVKKELNQWFFRITRYAEELLDFNGLDWPERVKTMQTNWIGRSEGAEVWFSTEAGDQIAVFTTRPDTLFGATFLVLAPEHPLVQKLTTDEYRQSVMNYVESARRQSEMQRMVINREKTGVPTGAYAVNPANGERIPVFVADYVLMQYGNGALMGVPAHDQRDFDFAHRHGLPIRVVVSPSDSATEASEGAYEGEGKMLSSGMFDGMVSSEAKDAITRWLEERHNGRPTVSYRMRDWLISRQRYWGAPIPVLYCLACGTVPVPAEQLPVLLPEDVRFVPTGESPLKANGEFLNTRCPKCDGPAERDPDTMDTFVDSSWYWLRYLAPNNSVRCLDPGEEADWLPVDQYVGGIEHATMHLLYARFTTKALRDMGHLHHSEPFRRLFNQGLMLGEDGEKMSKSRGNVVDPVQVVQQYGVDVFRTFLMFLGPWSRGGPWSSNGIVGLQRFLDKVWRLVTESKPASAGGPDAQQSERLQRKRHQVIQRVGDGIDTFVFNVSIAQLMEFASMLSSLQNISVDEQVRDGAIRDLVLMLAPFAPHLAEELWERLGHTDSVHRQAWPVFDPGIAQEEKFSLVIQVNGKVRDRIEVLKSVTEDEVRELSLRSEAVRHHLGGREPKHVIFVPQRLVNFVLETD
jgi:leucyl-tRNA synthetase